MRIAAVSIGVLAASGIAAAPRDETVPTFRSATALVSLDVSVVDDHGRPVTDLGPPDFEVMVDGRARPAVVAEYRARGAPAEEPAERYTSNAEAAARRVLVIVVDQGNIGTGGGRSVLKAADRLLSRLTPADRVALLTLPPGSGPQVDLTGDIPKIRRALDNVVGQARFAARRVAFGEALAGGVSEGGLEDAVNRECRGLRGFQRRSCSNEVRQDAAGLAASIREQAALARQSLHGLADRLRAVAGPKTLVLVSTGLSDENASELNALANALSSARIRLFVLLLDPGSTDASVGRLYLSEGADRQLYAAGLEKLAGLSQGTVIRIGASAEAAFERIAAEVSGDYLVGFQPDEAERDGRQHDVRVQVRRPGVTVRSHRAVLLPAPVDAPAKPEEILAATLGAGAVATDLPVRVATYTVREPGTAQLRLLVTAEIGREGAAPPPGLSVAFLLRDPSGRAVSAGVETVPDAPRPSRGPAAFVGAAAVLPGRYRLRLAALDARGLQGSVDHAVNAGLTQAGEVQLSDLILSDASRGATLRPQVGLEVTRSGCLAYLELYAGDPRLLEAAHVSVEVAQDESQAALVTVPARVAPSAEPGRRIAQASLPVDGLPPGAYMARAVVSVAGEPLRRVSQPFRLAR